MRELLSTRTSSSGDEIAQRAYLPESGSPLAALFLVHGLGDHTARYRESIEDFVDSGISVFGCDLPGHGESGGKRGHFESFDQLHQVIREGYAAARAEVGEDIPFGVFGHSMGGLVVLDLLGSGNHEFQFAWVNSTLIDVTWGRASFLPGLIRLVHPFLPRFTFPTRIRASECYPGADDQPPQNGPSHRRISLRVVMELIAARDRLPRGSASIPADFPLLLTHDRDDTICPIELARDFFRHLPGEAPLRKFLEYEGLLHEPWRDPRVLEDVAAWIGEIRPSLAAPVSS